MSAVWTYIEKEQEQYSEKLLDFRLKRTREVNLTTNSGRTGQKGCAERR